MMLPLQEILNKYDIHPNSVCHVGAHWAEEHEEYIKCGIVRFCYIEPCGDAFDYLKQKFCGAGELFNSDNLAMGCFGNNGENVTLWNVACGAKDDFLPMYVSNQNQGQSNSLLEPNLHLQQHPEVVFDEAEAVKVVTLDSLAADRFYQMLAMDVQGYEGEVLKGATETLKHINIIYTEVNNGQTYSGNMEIDEMDSFLAEHGFERVETYWPSPNWTWGDAIYIRK